MKFKDKIYTNLSHYKEQTLNISEMGMYCNNFYSHILPVDDIKLNILSPYRQSFFESEFSNIKLHKYFHHLNSSQAMCINFFYPLIMEKKLHLILEYIGFNHENINYKSVQFEKESKLDGANKRRPTNFDFYFETESGKHFYFEIKYTEEGFGVALNDTKHREKYEDVYKQNLSKVIQQEYCDMEIFFKHYQIIRNLIHIDDNSYVIFLYPGKNIKVSQSAQFAKSNIIKPEFSCNLINITWEDIVSHIEANPDVNHKYIVEFHDKYLPSP